MLAERNALEAQSAKEQISEIILSRVQSKLLNWAFVSWSAFASMRKEDERREIADQAVRQSMQQFHSQVATMRAKLDT
eukprot:COSAG02_NODE_4891_length_4859_cov_3.712605_3_plen_78_part_00